MTSACAPSPLALKLPPELLAGVFSHVTPHFETTDPACLVQWIRTTHVCHYWRDVALKYARLWTTFFLGPYCESTDPSLFDLCFQRSGSLPVALLCVVGDFGWVEDMLMSFALNDATQDKVKHLKIVGSKSHLLSLLSLMSYFPLSTLEFTINRTSKSDDDALWLPHPLLNQFIGLTSLSTTRCAFELDSVLYSPHLTTLELRNLPPSQRLPIITSTSKIVFRLDHTGTGPFMARDLLQNKNKTIGHLYRHDLESLFYVLIWSVVHNVPSKTPHRVSTPTVIAPWQGAFAAAATAKAAFLGSDRDTVLEHVQPVFQDSGIVDRWLKSVWWVFYNADHARLQNSDSDLSSMITFDAYMAALKRTPRLSREEYPFPPEASFA
ncbi:hypothetical protein ONZ45_g5306 [Pleurotus djamor]|nr:hypothetical protein ONZ45_g5306 [Pleurotus djamor]